jgi:CheY-like chemotaxis protein
LAEISHDECDDELDLTGKRIIVAEDNDLNWEIAFALLSTYGPEIERAENGSVCVEKFKKSREGFYDAILMDIRMPVMTGYEATEVIRSLERSDNDIPIIAMTADAFSEDIDKCIKCGMNAHIAKPIDVAEIVKTLARYL